ncbi:methyl-accepting chemotaxis protein [Limnohabitans sp. TS-CS-82]|uniref:methyl-accepting chemotaxis protein n=1 Tax=Limnohabitans sp. TS-CS-82 TaxID=2094193 RepID=UPI000CF2773D|nr:methyl-accepting chemotaxis protein [Limnohabitans sp. TS-CS-82]PQA81382.1 methyl-accepting chemotaxis protein [Limnohabitans sp. TS-CS-82]
MTAVYKKMSIANKLMMAPLLVAVLLLGFGIFSYANMHAFQVSVNALLADSVATERMAQETEATVNATHAAAYRSLALLNLKSDKAALSAETMMTEQLTALGDVGRDLEASPNARLRSLIKPIQTYENAVREAYDSSTSDTNLGAMMMQDADNAYDQLIETLHMVGAASRIGASNAQKNLNERIDLQQGVQIAALLFAIFAGLLLAYVAGKKIARPLRAMQAQISAIEDRADFSLRVKIESGDEVGQTALSLNALLQSLQNAVQEVNSVVGAVSAGDFSRRVEAPLKGDMAVMKAAVNDSAESVKSTMNGLNDMMQALQNGDFSKHLHIEVTGEYKRAMTQAVDAMQSLNTMLGDVGSVMKGVSQGDLSLRVNAQGSGDLLTLKNNINLSLDAVSGSMRVINQNARQVASASAQSSQAVGQISDGALNQTHAIGQVATAVRQTVTSVADVSRNTEVASQKSKESVRIVRDGIRKMAHMVEVVNSIAANSEKINKITVVIEKIANKTNLLSLNAAIEAARAGEHGKGFAVVADEVGKLAVNSAESSQEIAQLVQHAVAETRRAVLAVQEVSADMARIESGSQETDDMLQRIAGALEEQSTAVEQINANLSSVDNIARSNSAASEEITETVMELSKIADSTRREVEKFIL